MTIDRHFMGDVGLAVLLAFPTLTLARPQATPQADEPGAAAPLIERAALSERTQVERHFSLDG